MQRVSEVGGKSFEADLPSKIEDLSPELLTKLLSESRPGVRVRDLRVLKSSERGDGSTSTADRVTLELDFAPQKDAGLPSRMILKTILLHRALRLGASAISSTGRLLHGLHSVPLGQQIRPLLLSAIRAYQRRFPHAPEAMYRNEVRFYRDIRPKIDIEAPMSFASVYDDRQRSFGILMEDLSLRAAEFPNATMTLDVERIGQLLRTLAGLHARFWQSQRFSSELSWLATPRSGGMYPVFQALGLDLIRNQVETNPFKAELLEPLGRTVEQLWTALWRLQEILDSEPTTLLHGDPHIGNSYLLPEGRAGFLDWQLMVRGRWAHDVTYVIVTGLDTETRRTHERELLGFYLEELRRLGVSEAPKTDEAWELYRRTVAWGLVIGWLITPPENYGTDITAANIRRLVTAALDLQTFELL